MINENVINEARLLIGVMLRNFREQKKLSQTQVAEMIGVTTNTISKIEIGRFNFGIDIVNKLSVIYGFTINFLVKETGDKNRFVLQNGSEINTFIVTDTINEIVCKFKKGKFDETQEFTFLKEYPTNLATVLREFRDWLGENHRNIIF